MALTKLVHLAFRPFLMHPGFSFAGNYALHASVLEGSPLWGRTRINMSAQVLVQRRTFSGKMILRTMRNLVIGLVIFLTVGNVAIFLAFKTMSSTSYARPLPAIATIENLHAVDDVVWRGSAPGRAGYAELAERGVTTIIDLRAEDLVVDHAYIESLGMALVRIPMRDGQAPSNEQVDLFLASVQGSEGIVYFHCGAGVGRTGTMAAAYLVTTGQASGIEAVQRNLAVGPPSLEQLAFAASLESGDEVSSNPIITGISRILDAPRRILVRVRSSYGH